MTSFKHVGTCELGINTSFLKTLECRSYKGQSGKLSNRDVMKIVLYYCKVPSPTFENMGRIIILIIFWDGKERTKKGGGEIFCDLVSK
jgi:hypothetical protein